MVRFALRRFGRVARRLGPTAVLTAAGLLATPWPSVAVDLGVGETFQLHGFASQAYLYTTENNLFGSSADDGTFGFREIGLNASWRVVPRLQFAAQGLSRWAGESDDGKPRVDYALVDVTVVSTGQNLLGVRVGRALIPLGLYNETRDVAFTRPSILLPESIYFDRTRDLALSGDGGYVYGETRTTLGDVSVQAGMGKPRAINEEVEIALMGRKVPGDLESDQSFMGRFLYELDGGFVRAAVSGGEIRMSYDPAETGDPIPSGSFRFRPLIFSAQVNGEAWTLTSEYALREFRSDGFGPADKEFTGESWYLQGSYRLAPAWEVMARYDVLYTDRKDRDGREFEAATHQPGFTRFARDWTAGLRWDPTNWLMFRAEYHYVDGTAWIPRTDNPYPKDLKEYWQLFALQGSIRF